MAIAERGSEHTLGSSSERAGKGLLEQIITGETFQCLLFYGLILCPKPTCKRQAGLLPDSSFKLVELMSTFVLITHKPLKPGKFSL